MSKNDEYPVAKEWTDAKRGLRKELIAFKYQSVTKASDISKCLVSISEVSGLRDSHDTEYLRGDNNTEYWVTLGDALTPIDYYIEIFLKQMLIGETSRCTITTKSTKSIQFALKMIRIEFGGYFYSKSLPELVHIVQHYKENGVKMFKKYPLFAHEYFSRAAKLLISYLPFNTLQEREMNTEEWTPESLQELLETIYMNLAACLIKEKRYEEALHVLEFTDRNENVPDKAIYRRATAHFHLGQLDEAKSILERINYKESKECNALYQNVVGEWKSANDKYAKMVKKMFAWFAWLTLNENSQFPHFISEFLISIRDLL